MAIGPDQHRLCDDHGHFMVSWGSVTNCPVCGKRCKAHPHYHKKAAFHFIGAGNGYFSKALGREVSNKWEEEKIMNANGYVREADLTPHLWEDETEKRKQKLINQEREVLRIEEHINDGVEMGEAIAMVYSADRCLSGELDEIYDNQIDLTP
ncbi:MAG: hypothetical protein K0U52_13840 [Gammaproteobacteria bacterium]|nr:hypothetical protein [Gammaproteobacteria bacterium]